jgi:YfiH family protein
MSFTTHTSQDLIWLTAPLLEGQSRIRHGFSTRTGGVSRPPFDTLNLALGRGDDPAAVEENYRRFCAVAGGDPARTVLSRQVHEDTVRLVTEADAGKGLRFPQDYTADALITNQPGLSLVVFSADCGILLLFDPKTGAIGAIHAGWRGCAAGIVAKTVRELERVFGARPADLLCAIGPCIGPCCFETDDDVPQAMTAALGDQAAPYLERRGPKWHVDLAGLNREWLLSAGVDPAHIELCGLCTACHPELFWSHRKMGNARGGQVAMITLL